MKQFIKFSNFNTRKIFLFLKSTDFAKGLVLGVSIIIPVSISIYFGHLEIGLSIAVGALLSSPSDVTGTLRHKNYGIIISTIIAFTASLLGGFFHSGSIIILPVLGLVMFLISLISVYGFRASLVSFSGLLAIVLSLANLSNSLNVLDRALLIGAGGLWYLIVANIYFVVNSKSATEQLLAKCFSLTSEYVLVRSKLLNYKNDRNILQKKLLDLQIELNENHESLREILISSSRSSGTSNYERRRLLIFIQMVDFLEMAMANPVNYEKMDKLFTSNKSFQQSFQDILYFMHLSLDQFELRIQHQKVIKKKYSISEKLEGIKKEISELPNSSSVDATQAILYNMYDYLEKQYQKIRQIDEILKNSEIPELNSINFKETKKFLKSQDYSWKILWDNFSFKSGIFRHSLRLAVVAMVGYLIGSYFNFQNTYWILLTIIVIMRPNYGLTKTRSRHRITGTLIGAAIAILIVYITQNTVIYAILATVSLIFAFSMVQRNYKTSATFITLNVVFIYALLRPDVLSVIQYRVVDTVIGAGLAILGNFILWPFWEYSNLSGFIKESLNANKKILSEIESSYTSKNPLGVAYKLSRKRAYLAMGDLNSAFQRMTQEPKSKQQNLNIFYDYVVLNQAFLSSVASLSGYIQIHKTTEASQYFKNYMLRIIENLEDGIAYIEGREISEKIDFLFIEAEIYYNKQIENLKNNKKIEDLEVLKEAQIIIEQLKWQYNLTEKLKCQIKKLI